MGQRTSGLLCHCGANSLEQLSWCFEVCDEVGFQITLRCLKQVGVHALCLLRSPAPLKNHIPAPVEEVVTHKGAALQMDTLSSESTFHQIWSL